MSDFATTLKSLLSLPDPLDAIRAWVSETFPDPVVEVVPEAEPAVEETPVVEVVPEPEPVVEETPVVVAEEVVPAPAPEPVVEETPVVVAEEVAPEPEPVVEVLPEPVVEETPAPAPAPARPTFLPGVPTPARQFKLRFGLRNKF